MTRSRSFAIIVICLIAISAFANVRLISDSAFETTFRVSFDRPSIADFGGGYSYLRLEDFGARGEDFGPRLFGRTFSVAIPKGADVAVETKSIEWGEWQAIMPVPRCDEVEKGQIVPGNSDLYARPSGGTASFIGKKTIRNVEIADVDVVPVEYNPELGVRFMKSIELSVVHRGGGRSDCGRAFYHPVFAKMFQKMLVNPDAALPRDRTYGISEWNPDDGAELLVICYPYFEDEFQPWLDWKLLMGMPTKVVTTTVTGTDTASIKAYIQNAYDTWTIKPAYVLFVGDAENVATYTSLSSGPCIGDNEYGCVDGSDYFPDIFPGRMSCDAASQVDLLVQKQLNYECHPDTTDDWYARAIGLVSEDDPDWDPLGPQDSSYVAAVTYGMNQCTAAGFTDVHFQRRDPRGDAYDYNNYSTAVPYFEAGCGLVQYRGQAWPDYYHYGNYQSSYGGLDTLDNDGKCPVNISITCGTGGFMSGDTRMCERSTRAGTVSHPKGCVAFMGQTAVSSNSEERSSLSKHIFEGLFEARLNQLGAADTYGKNGMWTEFGGSSDSRYEYLCSALVGAPEMLTWTAPIMAPTVDFPTAVFVGPATINVNVMAGGSPVEDARVAIHKGSNFSYAMTDASGDASISLTADPSVPLLLVVTGPNIYPFQDTIDVLVSGVGIYTVPVTFEDVVGDSDGIINPGETIRFIPTICNLGSEGADTLTGVLRCTEPVVWMDSTTAFPYLAAGDTVEGDEVRFRVPANSPSVESMTFYLTISGHPDGPWMRTISPHPPIERFSALFESITVHDPGPLGNGDGNLTPGEVADICLTLSNSSQARLTDALGILLGNDRIAVIQNLAANPDWGRGEIAALSPCYTISLSPTLDPGEAITLPLELSGNGSMYEYLDTIDIPLTTTGDLSNLPTGPDSYGYYIVDNTDVSSHIEPTFEWTDISTIGSPVAAITNSDDGITAFRLPFTMTYYGEDFDTITLAANGYMCPGHDDYHGAGTGTPQQFPHVGGPQGIVAPVWADLAPHRTGGGEIYSYYDTGNHQYVVEWDSCSFYYAGGFVTYQLKICDPAYWPTPTGDSEFYIYYHGFTGIGLMGIGIESHDETIGIEYYRDGAYEEHAAVIAADRALRITTVEPDEPNLPWLYTVNAPMLDDSSGNNNGIVEPGETIGIRLYVCNGGTAMAPSVVGKALDTTYIAPLDEASFGTIMPSDTAYNASQAIHIRVSSSCPTDTVIEVPIELSALGGWYVTHSKIWLHVGSSVGIGDASRLPDGVAANVYPNPFNSTASIDVMIGNDVTEPVKLDVYDISGRKVATIFDGMLKPGRYEFRMEASGLPSGCYFVRLRSGDMQANRKMLLIR